MKIMYLNVNREMAPVLKKKEHDRIRTQATDGASIQK
jgi:hypothetical protein